MIDIGTGDGRVLNEVFVNLSGIKFSKVIGSDRRKDVIDFAQKTYGNTLINFDVLDIEFATEEDMQRILENGPFDFATSSFCLMFALDFEKTFFNINKLLKLEGSLYFNFLGTYNLVDVHFLLAEKYPQAKDIIYEQLPPMSKNKNFEIDFRGNLQKCGFDVDFLNFEEHDYDFVDASCFRGKLNLYIKNKFKKKII